MLHTASSDTVRKALDTLRVLSRLTPAILVVGVQLRQRVWAWPRVQLNQIGVEGDASGARGLGYNSGRSEGVGGGRK